MDQGSSATQTGTSLETARKALQAGLLVAIPTETVYGLAGNALDPDAVLRIFEAKKRPSFDPLIVHTHSVEALAGFVADFPPAALQLAARFWPGPLTLLLPRKNVIPDVVTSGLDTVAVRIPDHPLTLALLRSLDFPLAAPSANPFGYISPTTAQHVFEQLNGKLEYILDGGPAGIGLESTIIGFPGGTPTLYRQGGLEQEQIEAVIGPVKRLPHSTSNPQAPGMLKSHYAPRVPLELHGNLHDSTVRPEDGYLLFAEPLPGVSPEKQRVLSPNGDLREAARNLFTFLRELDTKAIRRIYAEPVPDRGLGKAINDRLRRAAAR